MSGGDAGRVEQRRGGGHVADELAVGVGVGHEVLGRRLLAELRGALVGRQHEPPRRRAPTGRRRPSGRPATACRRRASTPPTVGATSSTARPRPSTAACERGEHRGVGAVGDEHADLAAGEALGPFSRMLSAGDGAGPCAGRRGGSAAVGQLVQPEAVGDVWARPSSTLRRFGHHALADVDPSRPCSARRRTRRRCASCSTAVWLT